MKTYKDFDKRSLGYSDIASLVLRGCDNLTELHFGGDGSYSAYLVTEEAEIGSHYREVFRCHNWLWVYDDDGCVLKVNAPEIIVYRAGGMGCVIYAPHDKQVQKKRIVWRTVGEREINRDLAADYNTDKLPEEELLALCRAWETEDAADGLRREYWLEEV